MPNFTRDAIQASFLKLLNERPLSQIRVKDIAADCGINRNTFYYYFQDIPSLIETMVMEEAETIVQKYPSADTIRDFLDTTIDYMLERKTLFRHIYHSANREIFEHYLWQVCERIIVRYLDSVLNDRTILESDRAILIQYLKSLSFGILSSWLQSGLTDDIRGFFARIYDLKKGSVEEMIRRFTL